MRDHRLAQAPAGGGHGRADTIDTSPRLDRQLPVGSPVANRDSVEIATRHFYWKPVYAFLRVFELEAFAEAGATLAPPVLDLGSGDGAFTRMLCERGVLAGVQVAADISGDKLAHSAGGVAWGAVRADGRRLPFRGEAFGSVVSNAVICCIPTDHASDVDRTLAEAHRTLLPGGLLAFSVATTWYNRNLPLPGLYRRLGARGLAFRYLERLDRGLEHYQVYDATRWLEAVRRAGFGVERVVPYFTPRQAAWWNLFTLQVFRVFALSKLLRWGWARRLASAVQAAAFRPILARERTTPPASRSARAGYILVVARKPGPAAPSGAERPRAEPRIVGRRAD